MVVSCAICSDIIIESSHISACPCGHVFHVECLMHWFERSKSCPQCRESTNEKKLLKIFLNISEQGSQEDPANLIQKIDTLTLELHSQTKQVKHLQTEKEKLSEELTEKEIALMNAKDANIALESQNSAYRKHLRNQKVIENELASLQKEKEKADTKIKILESLQCVVTGSNSEADTAFLQLSDGSEASKSLVTLCSALKKQLGNMESKLKVARKEMTHYKSMQQKTEYKLNECEHNLQASSELVKRLEDKNEKLQKKIEKMKDSLGTPNPDNAKDKMLTRLLWESPMPEALQSKVTVRSDSPDVFCTSPDTNKLFQEKPFHSHNKKSNSSDAPCTTVSSTLGAVPRLPLSIKSNTVTDTSALAKSHKTLTGSSAKACSSMSKSQVGRNFSKTSTLFGPTRISRMASSDSLQKRLYQASKDIPEGMVYNGLGGTVKADHPIPSKKRFIDLTQ